MATVTVRNLPDEVHRALRVRAATHGRSTEAEIRDILESTVRPPERLRLGTALAELQLGEQARFFPTNEALAAWQAQAVQGQSDIVYE